MRLWGTQSDRNRFYRKRALARRGIQKVMNMKTLLVPVVVVASLGFGVQAQAAGCLSGAAVGGVAGHVAGGHGVAGAAVGCAIGHHEANKQAKAASAQQQSNASTTQPTQKSQ
jgi:hypothetical protein